LSPTSVSIFCNLTSLFQWISIDGTLYQTQNIQDGKLTIPLLIYEALTVTSPTLECGASADLANWNRMNIIQAMRILQNFELIKKHKKV
jgi:hypothetical protein